MREIRHSEVKDFTDRDLQDVYAKVEDLDVVGIESFKDDFISHLASDPCIDGVALPWLETHDLVRLRMKEISIWAGINGHKKSTVLSQVLLWAAKEVRVGLASFEMPIHYTAKMMCKQAACSDTPPESYGHRFIDWAAKRFLWYRVLGGVEPIQCLGAIVAMAKRGAKIIAIDNLQFTGVTEDMVRERLFFNQLIGLAEALDIHIAIVHHVRKPERGGDEFVPSRFDVRGSSSLVDQAHLLFIVWHNKKRNRILRQQEMGLPLTEKDTEVLQQEEDLKLIVAKQRNAPFEGTIRLWECKGQSFKKHSKGKSLILEDV
jgi:twinkle protein